MTDAPKAHPRTGLVPCEMLASEAGLGLRKGEIRGLDPEIAKVMIERGHARAVEPTLDEPARRVRDEKPTA